MRQIFVREEGFMNSLEEYWSLGLACPSKAQLEWQDMELGMFIHWMPDIGIFPDRETEANTKIVKELASKMKITNLDTDEWAKAAVDMGAKYIVFVAKHGHGFCRWQTETSEYSMKNTPYKNGEGDIVEELSNSCKKYNLKLGVYLSGQDWVYGAGVAGICKTEEQQKKYNKVYRQQLVELLTKYGDIMEIWFDGSLEIEVGDIIKKYAPEAMIFQSKYCTIRWVGQENGHASDPVWNAVSRFDAISGVSTQRHGTPNGDTWLPIECDARIRQKWGWELSDGNELRSIDELMEMYYRSVGHGAVLLLNHAPGPDGKIPEEDLQRGKEFGDEIRRRFKSSITETTGRGHEVVLDFKDRIIIDHVITMEDIRFGQRVKSYSIDGLVNGNWKTLCVGTAIGHKKIDFVQAVGVEKIRFRCSQSLGEPILRKLAVYYTGVKTPYKSSIKIEKNNYIIGEYGYEMFDSDGYGVFQYGLNACCDDAGQYELTFIDSSGRKGIDILSICVLHNGVEYPQYVSQTDKDNKFNIYLGGVGGDLQLKFEAKRLLQWDDKGGKVLITRVT